MTPPTVVVLGEVTDWLAIPPALRDSAVAWLATTPRAMEILRLAGQSVLIPEDLFSAEEAEQLCVPAYERLRTLCGRLDKLLPAGAGACSLALWELGARLDGVLWRATVLERLHVLWPRARVRCWPAGESASVSGVFELSRSACRWPAVLARMAWFDAEAEASLPTVSRPVAGRSVGQWLRQNPLFWSAVQIHRRRLGTDALARLVYNSPAWLMLKAPYDWGDTLRQLTAAGQRIIFDEPDRYYAAQSRGGTASSKDRAIFERLWSGFRNGMPHWAHGALEPVAEEFHRIIDTAPAVMKNLHEMAAHSAGRFNLLGVINAIGSDLRVQAVLAAYRTIGVPVAKWQHGSVWWNNRVTQRMDDSDLGTGDVHLVYGSGSQTAYHQAGRHVHCRVMAVGSARLDALHTCFGDKKRRPGRGRPSAILYTATNLTGDAWYCGFSPPFMDGLYYRDQRFLIDELQSLLESDSHLHLTIKLPPNYFYDSPPPWVEDLGARPNCRIVTNEQPHADLLPEHDAVIIDCATTTLLEALCTDRAVFVLLRAPRWPENELVHLRKRAVCALDPCELVTALIRYLKTGEYPADRSDETFIRRHGLMASPVYAATVLVGEMTRASVRCQVAGRAN